VILISKNVNEILGSYFFNISNITFISTNKNSIKKYYLKNIFQKKVIQKFYKKYFL
jgi:hypothetical protein